MMLVDFFLLGLLLGVFFGGKFSRLSQVPLTFFWVVIAGFGLRYVALSIGPSFVPPLQTLGMALAWAGTLWGLRLFGMPLVSLGAFSNFLVVFLNGGRMPASVAVAERLGLLTIAERLKAGFYPEYVPIGPNTRLSFLGDVLPYFSFLFRRAFVVSVGDYLLGIGIFLVLFYYLRKEERNEKFH